MTEDVTIRSLQLGQMKLSLFLWKWKNVCVCAHVCVCVSIYELQHQAEGRLTIGFILVCVRM